MMDLELPARIFYDSTIDHRERLRRLEEALAKSSNEEERVNLEQYIGDTHRALEMGIERWRVPDSPEGACDERHCACEWIEGTCPRIASDANHAR